MTVYQLQKEPHFPPATEAEEDGLLAVGGDFSAERLLNAYASGVFPWFEEGETIYWYAPNPRMILEPKSFKISKSLRASIKKNKFNITINTAFEKVINACANIKRNNQESSWISKNFIAAFLELHRYKFAHSVEVWEGEKLVGGLYGLAIGKVFFGESMFHLKADASKIALAFLVEKLIENNFYLIDCQQETEHIKSLGASAIPIEDFLKKIEAAIKIKPLQTNFL